MKIAVILFNHGGPDKLDNVEPFLFNLFNDSSILNLPSFIRYPLAKLISKKRAPIAKDIYKEIGGSSPILKLTQDQADSLEKSLNKNQKGFVCPKLYACETTCSKMIIISISTKRKHTSSPTIHVHINLCNVKIRDY